VDRSLHLASNAPLSGHCHKIRHDLGLLISDAGAVISDIPEDPSRICPLTTLALVPRVPAAFPRYEQSSG
jgi:hypothetical protein